MKNNFSPKFIYFDSNFLNNSQSIEICGNVTSKFIEDDDDIIIICGSYANSYDVLIRAVSENIHPTHAINTKQIIEDCNKILNLHIATIKTYATPTPKIPVPKVANNIVDATEHFLANIQDITVKIHALIKGVSYIKEISPKTTNLLCFYTSCLASVLLQSKIYFLHEKKPILLMPEIKTEHQNKKLLATATNSTSTIPKPTSKTSNAYIIPSDVISHNMDYKIAELVLQHRGKSLDIWTTLPGIMTANPKIIAHAKPIEKLSYESALEIGYLGGKILHPTAIQTLMKHDIPIAIFSKDKPTQAASIITNTHNVASSQSTHPTFQSNTPNKSLSHINSLASDIPHTSKESTSINSEHQCITITERDNFCLLTIKSTQMAQEFGYLAEIFKVFDHYKIPIETLSSSEISISVSFPANHYSSALSTSLEKLGEIVHIDAQTIVSLIGNNIWQNPAQIAKVMTALEDIPLNIVSLGQSHSNLNIVLDTALKSLALRRMYRAMFE